jgi:MarR family transcriptional regulator, transcriptional regulator for hemolysin
MVTLSRTPYPPGPERREFLERQPTYWLKRCYGAMRRTVDAELRAFGLTLSQRDVLLTLYEEGPLDQSTLRLRLGLEQSSVSRLVDGLARRGLVTLTPLEGDKRVRIAALTTAGRSLLVQSPGSSALAGDVMLEGLSNRERAELIRLLKHCAENLTVHEAAQDTSGGG